MNTKTRKTKKHKKTADDIKDEKDAIIAREFNMDDVHEFTRALPHVVFHVETF